jgi:hypothetical protein
MRLHLAAAAAVLALAATAYPVQAAPPTKQMEDLDRGLVSVRSGSGNLVSWRLLGTDPDGVAFNVYRGSTRVATGLTGSTNYLDNGATAESSYTVRAVLMGAEQAASPASLRFTGGSYLDVPIQPPSGGTTPDGVSYTYSANDAGVGDVDGDGQYEIVLKWDPSNAKDNSQSGYTGNVFVDAYRLNGTRLWRIDLGRNIRAGAHYTQFQVYDYDGDGRAEVAMKTADGTRDGAGTVIGSSGADHRNSSGYVLSGPEYLTMFNGLTGAAMSTVNYDPPRGTVSSWGDNYGNRVDRFLAGTAYLDGERPSLIMARGYYTRSVIAAWDFRNGALTKRRTAATRSSTAPWSSTTTAPACGPPAPATATPSTWATSTRPGPAWSTSRSASPPRSPARSTSTRAPAASCGPPPRAPTTAAAWPATSRRSGSPASSGPPRTPRCAASPATARAASRPR